MILLVKCAVECSATDLTSSCRWACYQIAEPAAVGIDPFYLTVDIVSIVVIVVAAWWVLRQRLTP